MSSNENQNGDKKPATGTKTPEQIALLKHWQHCREIHPIQPRRLSGEPLSVVLE